MGAARYFYFSAIAEDDAEGSTRILPLDNSFISAHDATGAAFKAAGAVKAHFFTFHRIQHCRANDQAWFVDALCANGFIQDNMWFTLVDLEFVQA